MSIDLVDDRDLWMTPRQLQNIPHTLPAVTRFEPALLEQMFVGNFPTQSRYLWTVRTPLPTWDDGGVRGEGGARNERGENPPIPHPSPT